MEKTTVQQIVTLVKQKKDKPNIVYYTEAVEKLLERFPSLSLEQAADFVVWFQEEWWATRNPEDIPKRFSPKWTTCNCKHCHVTEIVIFDCIRFEDNDSLSSLCWK